MNNASDNITFPIVKAAAGITAAVVVMAGVAFAVVSSSFPDSTVTASVVSMAAVVWLSTFASLVPFRVLDGRAHANSILTMYLAGTGLRLLLCLAAVTVAVVAAKLDAKATVVSLLVLYAPALAVEIAFVRGYLRRLFAKPQQSSEALA